MSWSALEVEAILQELRAGATVQIGGSRCHTVYAYRDGAWVQEDFDEGYVEVRPSSDAAIRERIAGQPEEFAEVLAAPGWRRFSAAFLAGEREVAREALRSVTAYGCRVKEGQILDAVLAWPEAAPSEEVVQLVRRELDGLTAYHVFMGATGWDRSPACGVKGVAFANQLLAMVGPTPGFYYLRATFHEQAGDQAAAERDIREELAQLPPQHWRREPLEQQLQRVRNPGPR